jgi:hypothetical protein
MAGPGETFGSLWALAGGFASQSDCVRVLPPYIFSKHLSKIYFVSEKVFRKK